VLELLLTPDAPQLVNVNFPLTPRGTVLDSTLGSPLRRPSGPGRDPQGRKHYWLTVQPIEDVEPQTDRGAVRRQVRVAHATALDLTDEDALRKLKRRPLD